MRVRTFVRPLLVGSAVLVLMLAVAPSAEALTVQRTVTPFDLSFTVPDLCSFPITLRFVGVETDTVYRDATGVIVRVRSHLILEATFTGNGTSITGPAAINETWDNVRGIYRVAGLTHSFTVAGIGTVHRDAGLLVFDLDTGALLLEAGVHQDFDGDYSSLCAALS